MDGLHFRADGGLDMRFSSSRAACASGFCDSGGHITGGFGSITSDGFSGGSSYSGGSSDLHYKRDGTLDMRYSSSKAAAASPSYGSSTTSPCSASSTNMHYRRDGNLDMRYKSSKQAAASGSSGTQDLHHKKDGTLDMRYKSSKQAKGTAFQHASSPKVDRRRKEWRETHLNRDGIRMKIDGTPDRRYKGSRVQAQRMIPQRPMMTMSLPPALYGFDSVQAVKPDYDEDELEMYPLHSFETAIAILDACQEEVEALDQEEIDEMVEQVSEAIKSPENWTEKTWDGDPEVWKEDAVIEKIIKSTQRIAKHRNIQKRICEQWNAICSLDFPEQYREFAYSILSDITDASGNPIINECN